MLLPTPAAQNGTDIQSHINLSSTAGQLDPQPPTLKEATLRLVQPGHTLAIRHQVCAMLGPTPYRAEACRLTRTINTSKHKDCAQRTEEAAAAIHLDLQAIDPCGAYAKLKYILTFKKLHSTGRECPPSMMPQMQYEDYILGPKQETHGFGPVL